MTARTVFAFWLISFNFVLVEFIAKTYRQVQFADAPGELSSHVTNTRDSRLAALLYQSVLNIHTRSTAPAAAKHCAEDLF